MGLDVPVAGPERERIHPEALVPNQARSVACQHVGESSQTWPGVDTRRGWVGDDRERRQIKLRGNAPGREQYPLLTRSGACLWHPVNVEQIETVGETPQRRVPYDEMRPGPTGPGASSC